MSDSKVFFSPKFLALLKEQTKMSPETAHKISNPMCGVCMAQRGREIAEKGFHWSPSSSD